MRSPTRWRRTWKLDRWLLVVVLSAPIVGLVGVVGAQFVPDGRIGNQLLRAEEAGILYSDEPPPMLIGVRHRMHTECIALSAGVGDGSDQWPVRSAILSPSYIGCEELHAGLRAFEATGVWPSGTTYLRYWHGYTVLMRPAIGVFGLAGARWIAFTVLAFSAGGMAFAVSRRFGAAAAMILVAPALLTTDMILSGMSSELALGMATAWIGGWMCLGLVSRGPDLMRAGLSAALAGAISAYVDLMTSMPGAFALAVCGCSLGVIAADRPEPMRRLGGTTAAAAAGWLAGLAWMWVSKWMIAVALVGFDEVRRNVKSQLEFRLSGDYPGVDQSRSTGITENLAAWWEKPLTPWIVGVLVGVLLVTALRRRPSAGVALTLAVSCTIVVVPVMAWYAVLNNHSQIHAWLVYRSLPMSFGAISTIVFVGLQVGAPMPGTFVGDRKLFARTFAP